MILLVMLNTFPDIMGLMTSRIIKMRMTKTITMVSMMMMGMMRMTKMLMTIIFFDILTLYEYVHSYHM